MKLAAYLFSGMLILLGVIVVIPSPGEAYDTRVFVSDMAFGGILIAWGGALAWSRQANYRGGLATIAGAFLLGFGASIALAPLYTENPELQARAGTALLTASVFLIPAVVLLVLGHWIHRRRVMAARTERVFADAEKPIRNPAESVEGQDPGLSQGVVGRYLDTLVEMSFTKGPNGEDIYHPHGALFKGRVVSDPGLMDRIIKHQGNFFRYVLPAVFAYALGRIAGIFAGRPDPAALMVGMLMHWWQGHLVRGLPISGQRPGTQMVMRRLRGVYPVWLIRLMIVHGFLLMAMAAAMPQFMGRPFVEIAVPVAIVSGVGSACVLLGVLLLRARSKAA